MAEILGLITARGGSKGLPRKNILPLAGRPLIGWTLDAARASRRLGRCLVSTDDEDIAAVARRLGGEVPFLRPLELAGDRSPHLDVVLHALQWLATHEAYRPDYVLILQPTSPLRTADDIDGIIRLALEHRADAAVSVCPAHDHPWLVHRLQADGTLAPMVACELAYPRRQDLPPAYALNGALFLHRCERLLAGGRLDPAGALAWIMPPERSLQIDTPWDLRLVELVLGQRAAGSP
jgi:CMP-N-acetylneuraminic acid synthetase